MLTVIEEANRQITLSMFKTLKIFFCPGTMGQVP